MSRSAAIWRILFGGLVFAVALWWPYAIGRAEPLAPTWRADISGKLAALSEPTWKNLEPFATPNLAPNCRYGAALLSAAQANWLAPLGAGWYEDFGAHTPFPVPDAEFAQMVRVRQLKNACTYLNGYEISPSLTDSGLGALVAAQPGALWIIGNEPDRGPNSENCLGPAQDDTYPEVYAQAYHDAYQFIKSRDASARVAIAGLVEATPGRLQYLERVWQTYQQRYGTRMPVDVWNMHLYILPEARPDGAPNGVANTALGTDPALAIRESDNKAGRCADPNVYCWAEHDDLSVFAQQVVAMRTWMKQHDEQNKPLILGEYSQLYPFTDYDDPINPTRCFLQDEFGKCFTQTRVTDFLNRSFTYLESATDPNLGYPLDGNRLVQQWLWFSISNPSGVGFVSDLVTRDLQSLSQPGVAYQSFVANRPTYVNLLPVQVWSSSNFAVTPTGTLTVTLSIKMVNNGNTSSAVPFTVTAYGDKALTQPIGSVIVTTTIGGCVQRTVQLSVKWSGLTIGTHFFWFKVDSTGVITESDESDNVILGQVTVYPIGLWLPLVWRS